MKTESAAMPNRNWIAWSMVLLIMVLGIAWLARPSIYKPLTRTSLAEAVSNARQAKLALDAFASDHNGLYPNEEFHERYGSSGTSSNDLLRQLFASNVTESQEIFWVKDSPVADKSPPKGRVPSMPLQPGVNHWAYAHGLNSGSESTAPILFDPWMPGTQKFDPDPWDNRAIIVTVDGSAKPRRIRMSDDKVLDDKHNDLFDPASPAWQDGPPDIRQPEVK